MNQQNAKDLKSKIKHEGVLNRLQIQPVTVVRHQSVDATGKNSGLGSPQKPQQLFWQKRLEGLRATNLRSDNIENSDLPNNIKPIGSFIANDTAFRSLITAVHHNQGPVIGQTAGKNVLEKHPEVFLDPNQPLVGTIIISNSDIRKQEAKVNAIRRKLALTMQDYEKR